MESEIMGNGNVQDWKFWQYCGKELNFYSLKYGCILQSDGPSKVISDKMEVGDRVVMVKYIGKNNWIIQAVGVVCSPPMHSMIFADLLGIDVKCHRYVNWRTCLGREDAYSGGFRYGEAMPIGMANQAVLSEIRDRWNTGQAFKLESFPESPNILRDEAVIDGMKQNGICPQKAEKFLNVLDSVRDKCKWYMTNGVKMTEQHTIVYLVAPILEALNWSDTQIKYQFCCADAGFFNSKGDCFRILEAKSMGSKLIECTDEGIRHAEDLVPVNQVVATNGNQFLLLKRDESRIWHMSSCLNVLNPIEQYTVEMEYGGKMNGALTFILDMMWKPES